MTQSVTYYRPPREEERLLWCDWMRHHGIDPNEVGMFGRIVRDEVNRQISYEDPRTGQRVSVQLEAVPSRFPVGFDRSSKSVLSWMS